MKATVISVRGQDYDKLIANPDFVYVGRRVRFTKWKESIWHNPYNVSAFPAAAAFFDFDLTLAYLGLIIPKHTDRHGKTHHHEDHFRAMVPRLGELQGKTLGCWCGDWKPGEPWIECHACVLAQLVNEIEESKR